jgi:hypothetical protein
MATEPDFYSANEGKKPAVARRYHNNTDCAPGRDIPKNERRSGTNNYKLCEHCDGYNKKK